MGKRWQLYDKHDATPKPFMINPSDTQLSLECESLAEEPATMKQWPPWQAILALNSQSVYKRWVVGTIAPDTN